MNTVKTVKIIETPYDLKGRDVICYPNLIFFFKIKVFRLFMKPRILYSAITVDLVKGNAARSNMVPEYRTIDINNTALIPAFIKTETAIEEAKKVVLRWARHKYKVYKVPEIEITKQEELYKVFFYAEVDNEEILIDSVKGIEMK